jgi:hypothetical protein
MGQNSQTSSAAFGQMGSAYTGAASQIRAPKGMAIIAIQFIDQNTPTELTAEVPTSGKAEYIDFAVAAHDTGDTTSTASTSGSSTTLTLTAANSAIRPGMTIESQGDTDIPFTLTTPTTVTAYDGATTVTMSAAHTVSSQTVGFFADNGSGFGGTAVGAGTDVTFPAGMTIFGRWTSITPSVNDAGGVICYFGI